MKTKGISLDTRVSIHPERIKSVEKVDEILSKIDNYQKALKCEAGVAMRQNMHLGASYSIVSKEKADAGMGPIRGKSEWYIKYYPRSYFEDLRERLTYERAIAD